ncbi:MAG: hypothetical protein IPF66_11845 [Holophagales bacterium]|nr:hypothetical protein [Holophagales bacterium]
MDAENEEGRQEETYDGRPQEVAHPNALLAKEAPEDPQDEQDDENRRDLRGEVEAVLHPIVCDRLRGRVRPRPVDEPQEGQLCEHGDRNRNQVFLPALPSAHARGLSTIGRGLPCPANIPLD